MVNWGLLKAPQKVSFQTHIRPIFERLTGLQWVNQGFASIFGAGTPVEAGRLLARLADNSPGNAEYRTWVNSQFRNPAKADRRLGKNLWPGFYGDALDSLPPPSEQNPDPSLTVSAGLASLTALQLGWLQKWAAGQFESDLDLLAKKPTKLDEVVPHERPRVLDEAALAFCLADAFHPGCELTWTIRMRTLYSGAYRIKRRPSNFPETDFGDVLTPETAVSPMGPLNGATAGDLTRWMAVPWQTDTASCLSGYSFFRTSDSLPSFWPARVPNDVLRQVEYDVLMDGKRDAKERMAAFYRREDWYRVFDGSGASDIVQMIGDFDKLGIIEERKGPGDLPVVPTTVWVESTPGLPDPVPAPGEVTVATAPVVRQAPRARYKLRKFGRNL
jgi:hypothetical protein